METKRCTKCGNIKNIEEYSFINKRTEKRRSSCKECMRKINNKNNKKYYKENRKKILIYQKEYIKNNKKKVEEYKKHNYDINMHDMAFKVMYRTKTRISKAMQNVTRVLSTKELIGCTNNELKKYLESQFRDGMNWRNYGFKGWHIDHIKPCASYNLTDPEQQKACFHYSNLQPLWWYENNAKRTKLNYRVS